MVIPCAKVSSTGPVNQIPAHAGRMGFLNRSPGFAGETVVSFPQGDVDHVDYCELELPSGYD